MYRQAIGKKGNRKGRKREGKTEHREEKGIGKGRWKEGKTRKTEHKEEKGIGKVQGG
jgi:hypothetical protein